jgi:hypothetical protein
MSVKVDLDQLADALADYTFAYLITVGDEVRVVPNRAVLHRKAAPESPAASGGCLHDCVPIEEG